MKLLIRVFLITLLLLVGYYSLLILTNIKPRTAESNYVANQIRLQATEYESGELNVVTIGSSISARLDIQSIEGKGVSLNIGLDGSNAIFGGNQLLNLNKKPRVLLIEMNTVYLDTRENDLSLEKGLRSGTHKLAKYFPLVRAESRPITILYSELKSFKDKKMVTDLNASDFSYVRPVKKYLAMDGRGSYEPCHKLEKLIKRACDNNIRVVLMIMPDGEGKPFQYSKLIDHMIKQYDVEVLDLKTPFTEGLVYTDGLHLSEPSAKFVTEVIANALK